MELDRGEITQVRSRLNTISTGIRVAIIMSLTISGIGIGIGLIAAFGPQLGINNDVIQTAILIIGLIGGAAGFGIGWIIAGFFTVIIDWMSQVLNTLGVISEQSFGPKAKNIEQSGDQQLSAFIKKLQ